MSSSNQSQKKPSLLNYDEQSQQQQQYGKGGHESASSPSMYSNPVGLSRLEGNPTGLSLPPLADPAVGMSIVKEGLSSHRGSQLESLRNSRDVGAGLVASRSKLSSQPKFDGDDNFSMPIENKDNNNNYGMNSDYQQNRYLDNSKTNSRVNLEETTQQELKQSQLPSQGGGPVTVNSRSGAPLSNASSKQKLITLKDMKRDNIHMLSSLESLPKQA